MRLVRYGPAGAEKPGLLDAQDVLRDLSDEIDDITGATIGPDGFAILAALDTSQLPVVDGSPRLGPPIGSVKNFIGVGLNYADHAQEAGMPIPDEPVLFNKLANCICGPNDNIIQPKGSTKLDYEVELAFVVGKRAQYVEEAEALEHIAGYCVCHDVSERAFQIERGGQWTKGKCAENFGPLGPWLVTTDEIGDAQGLTLFTKVNGEMRQEGTTSTLIFPVPFLLHYITQFMTLEPGDVVTTGTPPGVGMGMKPQKWLQPGDDVYMGVEQLGEQRQRVVAYRA